MNKEFIDGTGWYLRIKTESKQSQWRKLEADPKIEKDSILIKVEAESIEIQGSDGIVTEYRYISEIK